MRAAVLPLLLFHLMQGILLLGRSNNLTDEQLFDFEIIKRQHKNIVDIMTYDDLLKRFRNILNQIK